MKYHKFIFTGHQAQDRRKHSLHSISVYPLAVTNA